MWLLRDELCDNDLVPSDGGRLVVCKANGAWLDDVDVVEAAACCLGPYQYLLNLVPRGFNSVTACSTTPSATRTGQSEHLRSDGGQVDRNVVWTS